MVTLTNVTHDNALLTLEVKLSSQDFANHPKNVHLDIVIRVLSGEGSTRNETVSTSFEESNKKIIEHQLSDNPSLNSIVYLSFKIYKGKEQVEDIHNVYIKKIADIPNKNYEDKQTVTIEQVSRTFLQLLVSLKREMYNNGNGKPSIEALDIKVYLIISTLFGVVCNEYATTATFNMSTLTTAVTFDINKLTNWNDYEFQIFLPKDKQFKANQFIELGDAIKLEGENIIKNFTKKENSANSIIIWDVVSKGDSVIVALILDSEVEGGISVDVNLGLLSLEGTSLMIDSVTGVFEGSIKEEVIQVEIPIQREIVEEYVIVEVALDNVLFLTENVTYDIDFSYSMVKQIEVKRRGSVTFKHTEITNTTQISVETEFEGYQAEFEVQIIGEMLYRSGQSTPLVPSTLYFNKSTDKVQTTLIDLNSLLNHEESFFVQLSFDNLKFQGEVRGHIDITDTLIGEIKENVFFRLHELPVLEGKVNASVTIIKVDIINSIVHVILQLTGTIPGGVSLDVNFELLLTEHSFKWLDSVTVHFEGLHGELQVGNIELVSESVPSELMTSLAECTVSLSNPVFEHNQEMQIDLSHSLVVPFDRLPQFVEISSNNSEERIDGSIDITHLEFVDFQFVVQLMLSNVTVLGGLVVDVNVGLILSESGNLLMIDTVQCRFEGYKGEIQRVFFPLPPQDEECISYDVTAEVSLGNLLLVDTETAGTISLDISSSLVTNCSVTSPYEEDGYMMKLSITKVLACQSKVDVTLVFYGVIEDGFSAVVSLAIEDRYEKVWQQSQSVSFVGFAGETLTVTFIIEDNMEEYSKTIVTLPQVVLHNEYLHERVYFSERVETELVRCDYEYEFDQ